jgi:hypothetical protein
MTHPGPDCGSLGAVLPTRLISRRSAPFPAGRPSAASPSDVKATIRRPVNPGRSHGWTAAGTDSCRGLFSTRRRGGAYALPPAHRLINVSQAGSPPHSTPGVAVGQVKRPQRRRARPPPGSWAEPAGLELDLDDGRSGLVRPIAHPCPGGGALS